jgi:hypothetical protein
MNLNTTQTTTTEMYQGVEISKPTVDLTASATYLKLTFNRFGNTKKVETSQIAIKDRKGDVDKKIKAGRIRANKALLESPELEAIATFDRSIEKYVNSIALPYIKGIDLVPLIAVPDLYKKLKDFAEKRKPLVDKFLAKYVDQCKQASEDLGSTWRPQDYPPVEQVAQKFAFYWQFVKFGVPDLSALSPELWEEEKQKAADQMAKATEDIQLALRESLLKLTEHMADKLTPDETGTRKKLFDSMIPQMEEFLRNFEFRNITNDNQMAELVAKARNILLGVDIKRLKKSRITRDRVRNGMETIAKQLESMIVPVGARKFRDED